MIRATAYRDGTPREPDAEQEALKRAVYEKMSPGRRKFIDRIGYENWDPFQKPKDPLDMRLDATRRTTARLVREFLQQAEEKDGRIGDNEYRRGVLECALGIVNRDEKYLGVFDFCVWYHALLKEEGQPDERKI
jgi:hypothetical protein